MFHIAMFPIIAISLLAMGSILNSRIVNITTLSFTALSLFIVGTIEYSPTKYNIIFYSMLIFIVATIYISIWVISSLIYYYYKLYSNLYRLKEYKSKYLDDIRLLDPYYIQFPNIARFNTTDGNTYLEAIITYVTKGNYKDYINYTFIDRLLTLEFIIHYYRENNYWYDFWRMRDDKDILFKVFIDSLRGNKFTKPIQDDIVIKIERVIDLLYPIPAIVFKHEIEYTFALWPISLLVKIASSSRKFIVSIFSNLQSS